MNIDYRNGRRMVALQIDIELFHALQNEQINQGGGKGISTLIREMLCKRYKVKSRIKTVDLAKRKPKLRVHPRRRQG